MKKRPPRLLYSDIYSYIANNTSLNRTQVKECFDSYYDLIMDFIQSEYADKDLTIPLPQLGQFYFHKRKGRPDGSTYKMFVKQKEPTLETRVFYNDPSYYILKLKVSKKLNEILKERSKFYEH